MWKIDIDQYPELKEHLRRERDRLAHWLSGPYLENLHPKELARQKLVHAALEHVLTPEESRPKSYRQQALLKKKAKKAPAPRRAL